VAAANRRSGRSLANADHHREPGPCARPARNSSAVSGDNSPGTPYRDVSGVPCPFARWQPDAGSPVVRCPSDTNLRMSMLVQGPSPRIIGRPIFACYIASDLPGNLFKFLLSLAWIASPTLRPHAHSGLSSAKRAVESGSHSPSQFSCLTFNAIAGRSLAVCRERASGS